MFGGQAPAILISLDPEEPPLVVTVAQYRARQGESDAIVALHEDWRRHWPHRLPGMLSAELLQSKRDPHEFLQIVRFQDEASVVALNADPEHEVWSHRLASLSAEAPTTAEYVSSEGPG